jgi:hypothetical protein
MWKAKSEQAIILDNATSLSYSFSLTALMSLRENIPIVLELYENSNTSK